MVTIGLEQCGVVNLRSGIHLQRLRAFPLRLVHEQLISARFGFEDGCEHEMEHVEPCRKRLSSVSHSNPTIDEMSLYQVDGWTQYSGVVSPSSSTSVMLRDNRSIMSLVLLLLAADSKVSIFAFDRPINASGNKICPLFGIFVAARESSICLFN